MSHNGTLMQYFHWYISPDENLWNKLRNSAGDLANKGFTAMWLPPAYKAWRGIDDVGYGTYDLFDLGEFNQKGTVRTRYGTKDELLSAIKELHSKGIQVYADVVFNHKIGGDNKERVTAQEVDSNNRNRKIGGPTEIEFYSHFNFPGRGKKHSATEWFWWCFDSVRVNGRLYTIADKQFETEVARDYGNYDYLLGNDLDTSNEFVRGELKFWGEWFLNTTRVDGFRIDAVKHIRASFFREWLDHVRNYAQKDLFAVGEYWDGNVNTLNHYIHLTEGKMSLVDVPLHYHFHEASKKGESYNMSRILEGTLLKENPAFAVTFVENHDTQPLQMLESVVEPWFKPLAYAFILLHKDGYPCVFYPDYYGAHYKDKGRNGECCFEIFMDSHSWIIDKLLYARTRYAYGEQKDYFDHQNIIGWTRLGDSEHPKSMALLMSNGPGGSKWMETGKPNTSYLDITAHVKEPVHTNNSGWGEFRCNGGSVSVWIEEESRASGFRFSG